MWVSLEHWNVIQKVTQFMGAEAMDFAIGLLGAIIFYFFPEERLPPSDIMG